MGDGTPPDFFISYTARDRKWAEWMAWVLENKGGFRVVIQAWDVVAGTHWVTFMDKATASERTIAVLSAAYERSAYGTEEWHAAYRTDPSGLLRRLIPVRVENLLPACKNLGVTAVTNGAFRLHPVEWNIGEAAGALAAFCLSQKLAPRQVRNTPQRLADFQLELERQGVELDWPRMETARSYYSHHNLEIKDAADFYFGEAWRPHDQ